MLLVANAAHVALASAAVKDIGHRGRCRQGSSPSVTTPHRYVGISIIPACKQAPGQSAAAPPPQGDGYAGKEPASRDP